MRLIIAGSRDVTPNLYTLDDYAVSAEAAWGEITTILVGGARGTDQIAETWARDVGLHVEVHPADWTRHGRSAGPRRNREMARQADALLAFWDQKSRGTENMIEQARRHGLQTRVVHLHP